MASGAGDEDEGSSFQIVVKTMFGEFFNLTVTNADTIKAVKQKITTKLNIPEEGFTLLYNTRCVLVWRVSSNVVCIPSSNVMFLVNYNRLVRVYAHLWLVLMLWCVNVIFVL